MGVHDRLQRTTLLHSARVLPDFKCQELIFISPQPTALPFPDRGVKRMMQLCKEPLLNSGGRLERLEPEMLAAHQLARLNRMLETILPENRFYAHKLADVRLPLQSLDQLDGLPFTFKDELQEPGNGEHDYAANLTYPVDQYVRFHRTSGTRGRPSGGVGYVRRLGLVDRHMAVRAGCGRTDRGGPRFNGLFVRPFHWVLECF